VLSFARHRIQVVQRQDQPSQGSQKVRRHGGYRPQHGCGSQQRGAAPRMAEGRAGEGAGGGRPSRKGSPGLSTRKNFEITNAKCCILMHFQPCPP